MSISPEAIRAIASRLFAIYVALADRSGMLFMPGIPMLQ
jgi:hypothetical protein